MKKLVLILAILTFTGGMALKVYSAQANPKMEVLDDDKKKKKKKKKKGSCSSTEQKKCCSGGAQKSCSGEKQ